MYRVKQPVVFVLVALALCVLAIRGHFAIADLINHDQTRFLAFPLTVILPASAFAFLAWRRNIASQEGVLMQLGAMIQILLIISVPKFALHLALGCPVVFLVVELFETKMPTLPKTIIKGMLIE